MSKRRKALDDNPGDNTAWMATFSDLNFLMITFFVLLLSMSSMDERRFSDVSGSEVSDSEEIMRPEPPMGRSPLPVILQSRGSWVGQPQSLPMAQEGGQSRPARDQWTGMRQHAHRSLLDDPDARDQDLPLRSALEKVRDIVTVEAIDDDEITLSVEERVFFDQDTCNLTPRAVEVVRTIAGLSSELEGRLHVRAHRGPWALSAKRAGLVASMLDRLGVPGNRVVADVVSGREGTLEFSFVRSVDRARARVETGAKHG
jgi:flagellar motor protein MotB